MLKREESLLSSDLLINVSRNRFKYCGTRKDSMFVTRTKSLVSSHNNVTEGGDQSKAAEHL